MSKYTDMSPGDMLTALGDDAMKWAEAFREQHPEIEQSLLFAWFANAIEHSTQVRFERLIHDDQVWMDFQAQVFQQRRMWREIAAGEFSGGGE